MSNSTTSSVDTSSTPAPTSSSDLSSIISSISSQISSSIVSPSSTTTVERTSTSTLSLSSVPPTTQVITSVVTATPTASGESATPVTVVVTRTNSPSSVAVTHSATTGHTSSTSSSDPALNTGSGGSGSNGGGGLGTAGITAIAVVVPVVVVALLVFAGIFFWRRRKQKKAAEEARQKEIEDYGFNPNNDPTLPTVASESGHEMTEDSSGYRGWGAAGAASNRKMSTTLSGGHTHGQLSDAGSNQYRGAGSSGAGGASDGHSGDAMLHQRRETMNSDDIGSLGVGPVAGAGVAGMKRGPSNASSTYSAGQRSEGSDGAAPPSMPQSYEAYNPSTGYGYSQHGPYGDGTYGGNTGADGMPVVQDVSARRNTRIQQPGNYQQGNSGIAQNF